MGSVALEVLPHWLSEDLPVIALYLNAGSRARAARYFLLRGQEKVPKEKAARVSHPYRGALRFSPEAARAQLAG